MASTCDVNAVCFMFRILYSVCKVDTKNRVILRIHFQIFCETNNFLVRRMLIRIDFTFFRIRMLKKSVRRTHHKEWPKDWLYQETYRCTTYKELKKTYPNAVRIIRNGLRPKTVPCRPKSKNEKRKNNLFRNFFGVDPSRLATETQYFLVRKKEKVHKNKENWTGTYLKSR